MEAMEKDNNNFLVAAGIGILWSWLFCLFPSMGSSSTLVMGNEWHLPVSPWLVSLVAGSVASVMLALAAARWRASEGGFLAGCLFAGCVLQLVTAVFLLRLGQDEVAEACVGVCAGCSIALLWIPWGRLLAGLEVSRAERSLVGALIAAAVVYALLSSVPDQLGLTLFFLLPLLQVGAFALAVRETSLSLSNLAEAALPLPLQSLLDRPSRKGLVQCLTAYGLISLSWESLRFQEETIPTSLTLLFSVGFLLAAVMLELTGRHARRVDVATSARWALPAVAFGVALGIDASLLLMGIGFLLTAVAHASVEGVMRLQIVSVARRRKGSETAVVATGFAAISVGALLGVLGFFALSFVGGSAERTALFVLAVVASLGIVCFGRSPDRSTEEASPKRPPSKQEVVSLMTDRFGLTPRETEILSYLLEGRSAPYIREELVISKSTVDTHVRHIYAKVGVASKQDLISLSQEME